MAKLSSPPPEVVKAPGYKAVLRHYQNSPRELQKYFEHIPKLILEFPFEVVIGYIFMRLEGAHNDLLYRGMVRVHRIDSTMARAAVDNERITRAEFQTFFKAIFGVVPPAATLSKLTEAEGIRDRVIHGKSYTYAQLRQAVVRVLDYANEMNEFVSDQHNLRPFSPDARGFAGGAEQLAKSTSRLVMKGLGFTLA